MRMYASRPQQGLRSRIERGLTPDSIMWRRSRVESHHSNAVVVMYGQSDCGIKGPSYETDLESSFEFLHHVKSKLTHLRNLQLNWDDDGGQPPTGDALICMYQTLKGVADRRTVFPFLSPTGDGGLVAEWHANGKVLEVIVEPDGSTFLYGKDADLELLIDAQDSSATRRRFRRLLVTLSTYVHRENPTWRELFK